MTIVAQSARRRGISPCALAAVALGVATMTLAVAGGVAPANGPISKYGSSSTSMSTGVVVSPADGGVVIVRPVTIARLVATVSAGFTRWMSSGALPPPETRSQTL